jgi:hypothetical protein
MQLGRRSHDGSFVAQRNDAHLGTPRHHPPGMLPGGKVALCEQGRAVLLARLGDLEVGEELAEEAVGPAEWRLVSW